VKQGTAATSGMPDRAALLRALREMYAGPSWVGPTVRRLVRGVPARQASWRPAPGRNTIWELTLHLALARHILVARITGERALFPRPRRSSWWARTPADGSERAWRSDVALLADCQRRLIAAVERAPASRLTRVRAGGRTIAHELLGVVMHDAYHAGQISLLSRLAP